MDRLLNEEELQDLYAWIDKIPLSRAKRHITRDFSDGVMAAEVVKHFFPKLVELHNYVPANSTPQKHSNWELLNRKVLSKLDFHVTEAIVNQIVLSTAGAIEPVLWALRDKIDPRPEKPDSGLDLEYYSTRNQESAVEEVQPQTEPEKKKEQKGKHKKGKEQPKANLSDLDTNVQLLMQEKDKELLSLQETVEILQVKVSKLEHLVRLKDMRIEELTRHLETYKSKTSSLK